MMKYDPKGMSLCTVETVLIGSEETCALHRGQNQIEYISKSRDTLLAYSDNPPIFDADTLLGSNRSLIGTKYTPIDSEPDQIIVISTNPTLCIVSQGPSEGGSRATKRGDED